MQARAHLHKSITAIRSKIHMETKIMTKLVLIGLLNRKLDLQDDIVIKFNKKYKTYAPLDSQELNGTLIAHGSIEAGGHGDTGERITLMISKTGFTAQLWNISPTASRPDSEGKKLSEISEIARPQILQHQFCLIFDNRDDYDLHLGEFKSFYAKYFGYVTTILSTDLK